MASRSLARPVIIVKNEMKVKKWRIPYNCTLTFWWKLWKLEAQHFFSVYSNKNNYRILLLYNWKKKKNGENVRITYFKKYFVSKCWCLIISYPLLVFTSFHIRILNVCTTSFYEVLDSFFRNMRKTYRKLNLRLNFHYFQCCTYRLKIGTADKW